MIRVCQFMYAFPLLVSTVCRHLGGGVGSATSFARAYFTVGPFRGGSTPDNDIPDAPTIRQVLEDGREQLLETLADFNDDQLSEIVWTHPQSNRDLTLLTVLHILNWHEGHHQGQAHITLNLFRAQAD